MTATVMGVDEDRCYEALVSRDARFDGQFIAAITSTGIYCRASCPAPVRPKRANVRVFPTAAAAQAAGFRSCKRCRPDAAPGSPEWDRRGDLVGRAMRLIESGEIDRSGVAGVAAKLHVSERHLHRVLTESVGASPVALARAHRANLARILLETSVMPITDVGYAAGFASIRQFNDTIRSVYDRTPTELRRRGGPADEAEGTETGRLEIGTRLPFRPPLDFDDLFGGLDRYGIPGVTHADGHRYERILRLPGGPAIMSIEADGDELEARFSLATLADLAPAIATARRLLDLDADPVRIGEHFVDLPIGELMRRHAGVRVTGAVDGFETLVGTVLSQQVSLRGARTLLGRLVEVAADPVDHPTLTHAFPTPEQVVDADLSGIGMTGRRLATLRQVAGVVASGQLQLDAGADREHTRDQLLEISGIGPWTADIVAMRALRDPDVLLRNDLLVDRVLETLDGGREQQKQWSPWRSYVTSALRAEAGSEKRT